MMWLPWDLSSAVLRKWLEYCGTFCRRILKFHVLWTGGCVVFSVCVQFIAVCNTCCYGLLTSVRTRKKVFSHNNTSASQHRTKLLKNISEVISQFHRAFPFTIYNGPTKALVSNKTLIQMSHTKTLKITPTCFDHQMIIVRELFDPG
jgi:hypothetical protein